MQKSGCSQKFFGFLQTFIFKVLVLGVISFFVIPFESLPQGNLLIMPRRVVFEGAKKSADLILANTGTDSAKYIVSIVQMRMKNDGSFEQITKPDSGQYFADKYLRMFPRTVYLAPNESQTIKLQLNKVEKLPSGEYRSHIYFRSVPKENARGEKSATNDTTQVTIQLVPIFGITIPVIIRAGETSAKLTMSGLSLELMSDTLTTIKMKFDRSGNCSVYGDVKVDYFSPKGKVTQVANVKGIAVYTPNTFRFFQCKLNKVSGIDYHTGKLVVSFISQSELRTSKLAEAELLLH